MLILNLGCGTKVSSNADIINIDWSIYLRIKRNPLLSKFARIFLTQERLNRLYELPENIMLHNLARSIPFSSDSVDAVYHSHLFEHLDKDVAWRFLKEIERVLKPGGVLRIVVPDFEVMCRAYLNHFAVARENPAEADLHDEYISRIIEQSVRREAYGTSKQTSIRRWIENIVLGDARQRGETHQWQYDSVNLRQMLLHVGYQNIQKKSFNDSLIPNWKIYGLDIDENGNEYKPDSLYLEAQK